MSKYQSTKLVELGSCAFRQWRATHSHCQYIHGYQLKAKLWFGCDSLDEKNWVVDFGGLKDLKKHLNDIFDHTMTVAADDPELETFKDLDEKGIIQLRVFDDGVGIERVAEFVHQVANDFVSFHTKQRCWVDKVEVFEHENNSATYCEHASQREDEVPVLEVEPTSEELEAALSTMTQPLEQVPTSHQPKKSSSSTRGNWFKGTTWG
jgi:6-pyruvoyltetrahydropterin/6-carboxytetrahydropterin synthase